MSSTNPTIIEFERRKMEAEEAMVEQLEKINENLEKMSAQKKEILACECLKTGTE